MKTNKKRIDNLRLEIESAWREQKCSAEHDENPAVAAKLYEALLACEEALNLTAR